MSLGPEKSLHNTSFSKPLGWGLWSVPKQIDGCLGFLGLFWRIYRFWSMLTLDLWLVHHQCKGLWYAVSLSSPTLPLFVCIPPAHLCTSSQGPHLKLTTFQKPTHRMSSTSHLPLRSYLSHIGQASDALGQACVTLRHPPPSRGTPFIGGLVLGGLVL
jgi:hypothetical protein